MAKKKEKKDDFLEMMVEKIKEDYEPAKPHKSKLDPKEVEELTEQAMDKAVQKRKH